MRPIWKSQLLAMLALCLFVVSSRAADDVLTVIPDDALGFVVVNRPAEINEKVTAWATKLSLPIPGDLLQLAKLRLGIQDGLDDKGSIAIAALPGENDDAQPIPILFIPTSDYAAFIKPLEPENAAAKVTKISLGGDDSLCGKKGNFAVLTPRSSAEAVLKRVLDSSKGIAGSLNSSLREYVGAADACVVVGPAGIKLGATKGVEAIEKAKEQLGALGGDNEQLQMAKMMMGIYSDLLKGAQKDLTHAAFALRWAKEGDVHLGSRLIFTADSKAAKTLGNIKSADASVLSGLPDSPFVVAGGGIMPHELVEGMMTWSIDMMRAMPGGEKLSKEKATELAKLSTAEFKNIKSMAMVLGVGEEEGSIYSALSGVAKVEDAKAYLANYKKSIGEATKLLEGIELPYMGKMTAKDLEFEGLAGIEVEMEMAGIGGKDAPPGFEAMMEKLIAPGGKLKVYMASPDNNTVVIAYTSKENLGKAVKAAKDTGLGGNNELRKTAAMLPSGAQWVGYLSPKGTFEFGMRIARMIAGEAVPPLPALPPTAPLGFGAKASSEGLETDVVIPATTIEAIVGYAMRFQER